MSDAEIVLDHVRAFNAGDLDALLGCFTDDAVWITGRFVARGRDDLAELFTGAFAELRPRLEVLNLVVDTGKAACQLTETLTVAGELRTYHIAAFFQLRGGRIASAKVYREGSAVVE